jgi:cell division protein FtsB
VTIETLLTILSTIVALGAIIVASIVALVVGRRRGLDQVEARADSELQKTISAQAQRLTVLEAEVARLTARVAELERENARLTLDLQHSDAALRKAITRNQVG